MEMLEGVYSDSDETVFMSFMIMIEEGLEMLGGLVFLYALCSYLGSYAGPVKIVFKSH